MIQAPTIPVRITHIGGPTVLIEIGPLRILTDPTFDPAGTRYVDGPYELVKKTDPARFPSEIGEVHTVLLSHDQHIDNLDSAGRAFLSQVKQVLTTPVGAQRLEKNAQGVPTWETVTLSGINHLHVRVTSTPARHGPPELEDAMGDVTGWILEWEGQQHGALYVSGDTVLFEALHEIPQRFQVGTVLLHFGAAADPEVLGPVHLTFSAGEGSLFAKALGKAMVIPIHYEGWAHLSEGRAEIEEAFAKAGLEDQLCFLPFGQSVRIDV
ncbi:MBL fold metallo-hydrolase [Tengunoibacter tsumagoiensis]|uniref:MBL fold metallo-hydrolase n=1 Tax=Tengunoibacter tsumagoiensis TaxID=2014871 RepID=A0A401ZYK7_9CHLR|nr:MBL fold metallo-hydrolase [Tengunoibacter tsumagoiensis]GCE11939.1 MBL fold metallo-hydrolase [Tengunoibacter tsumagoiensis]